MADKSLAEKMKLKGGMFAAVVNPPAGYLDQLSAPRDVEISNRLESGPFDWVQIFVNPERNWSRSPLCSSKP